MKIPLVRLQGKFEINHSCSKGVISFDSFFRTALIHSKKHATPVSLLVFVSEDIAGVCYLLIRVVGV